MRATAKGVIVPLQPTLPRVIMAALALWALAGCAALPAPEAAAPPTSAATVARPTSAPAATAELVPAPAAVASPAPALRPYSGPQALVAAQPPAEPCEQPSPLKLPSRG